MLSRVADSIFWMNRYIERAENVARFIDVNQKLTLGFRAGMMQQWEPLIQTTGDTELFKELYGEEYTQENVVRFLAFDARNPNSILTCTDLARENARQIRDNLTAPMWEAINKFYLKIHHYPANSHTFANPQHMLDIVKAQSQLIEGATSLTLRRSEAWNISRLGRLIERADKTSRILDVKYYILLPSVQHVGSDLDIVQWSALLDSASALQMYRKTCGRIQRKAVVKFLLLDRLFPRSLHYCLVNADEALRFISGSLPNVFSNPAEQLLGRMKTNMDYASVDEIIESGLHEFIDAFQRQLNDLGEAIRDTFYGNTSTITQSQTQYSY
ncbi:MAG: alpha-E domain-containing protein [Planctomycetaceae bacterium]|nr:alpha-E domain-containing protein [Planctomycetaceae bacterium]